jgi:putative aldouronate transport system permease protein
MKYPVLLSVYKAIAQKMKRGISMFLQNKKETVKKDNKLNTIMINEYKIFKNNLPLLLMCLPAVILIIMFTYLPMFGITIAFKDFNVAKGLFGSDWVGFKNFKFFFTSLYAWRITRNTLGLNLIFIMLLLFSAVGIALMLNEIRKRVYVKFFQTTMFFPHFLSWVVVTYMVYAFLNIELGILNNVIEKIGYESIDWYADYRYWPFILTFLHIWKHAGYFSIIFYAGIMGISSEYYEAAKIDGATKLQMIRKITIPLLMPIIVIVTLLQIGRIFYADFGLFFQVTRDIGMLYPVTDVIDTYVYRALRVTGDIGMASAAGFYQSIIGFCLVLTTNLVVKKINSENALF